MTKDFDAEFKVFTKSGKAKFVTVDDQSQFKITLDYEFETEGPTHFPQKVYPTFRELYKHSVLDIQEKIGIPNTIGEV